MNDRQMLETCKSALNAAEYLSTLIEGQTDPHVQDIIGNWSSSIAQLAKFTAIYWQARNSALLITVNLN